MKKEKSVYNSIQEFKFNDIEAYNAICSKKMLKEICENFGWRLPKISRPQGYWTFELCLKESLKYTKKADWKKFSPSSYGAAQKKGWLDELCKHMEKSNLKPSGYWTKKCCIKEALKYETKVQWIKLSPASYDAAYRNNWIEICSKHMISIKKQNNYWTKKRCVEDALKYKTRTEWCKNSSSAYSIARNNSWLNECCMHMNSKNKMHGYWTKERCVEDALKYNTSAEWKRNSGGSIAAARKNGWLEECCKHMKKGSRRSVKI